MWLALLLSCALLGGAAAENLPWYHQGTVYQLYPRSFLDTNGDGIGDLRGIINKVDYLASLGIDAVWLNPIYPTQNKDFGYDITDYEGINPEYGTMADFEELVKKLGEKGVRVVMDYVPNHTSNLHPWFAKSVAKEDPYTNFYVWLPAKYADKNMPPNNWTGTFGGSMWKYHDGRKEMYLHQFLPEQPDLNYRSEDLIEAMKGVLTFWLKKGVAGFRMDTVATMVESDSWLDEPYNGGDPNDPGSYSHTMTTEQELTYKVLRQFKETLEKYSNETKTEPKIMMTESWCNDPLTLRKYYGTPNAPATTFPFNFLLMMRMNVYSSAKDWADAINYWYYPGPHNDSVMPGNWAQPNLVLGNHDQHRYASRFTPEHSDILRMVQMTVKGTAVVYYGDELGLTDSLVRRDQAQDIQGKLAPPGQFYEKSRDPQRGPMPWNTVDANAGFTNSTPWLPLTSDYMTNNVETQENATHSHLNNFRALAALRKRPTLLKGACQVTNSGNILLVIRELADNPTVITAVNMGHLDEILDLQSFRSTLPDRISVLVRSINYLNESKVVDSNHVRLPPLTGVVLSSWNENPAGTS